MNLNDLIKKADRARQRHCGNGILLRAIVEFSNVCSNRCAYCGLGQSNNGLTRYQLSLEEASQALAAIKKQGIKTVIMQSGENDQADPLYIKQLIELAKYQYQLAVTLSVGEKSEEDYCLWKKAGADRYLLKIETTDKDLYQKLHPGMTLARRMDCLATLKKLGYQTGSGNIIGLPGQSMESIANDLKYFERQNFDMLAIGPFIPHPATPLANEPCGSIDLTLKTIALARIMTKNTHIAATTALAHIVKGHNFQREALLAGANVIMVNFTPAPYNQYYTIYPKDKDFLPVKLPTGRYFDYSVGHSLKKELSYA